MSPTLRTHRGEDLGEEETETPSYLQEGTPQLPDFIDEAPQPTAEQEQVRRRASVNASADYESRFIADTLFPPSQHEALKTLSI